MIWAKQPSGVCSRTRNSSNCALWLKKAFFCFYGQEFFELGGGCRRRHSSPGLDPAGERGKQSGTAATGLSMCDTTGSIRPRSWEKRSGKWILGLSQPSVWTYCRRGPKLQSWHVRFWNHPYHLGMCDTGFGSSLFPVLNAVRAWFISIAQKKRYLKKKSCLIKIFESVLTEQCRSPC